MREVSQTSDDSIFASGRVYANIKQWEQPSVQFLSLQFSIDSSYLTILDVDNVCSQWRF